MATSTGARATGADAPGPASRPALGAPSPPRPAEGAGIRGAGVARSSGAGGVARAPGFLKGLKRSVTKPARPPQKSRGVAPTRGRAAGGTSRVGAVAGAGGFGGGVAGGVGGGVAPADAGGEVVPRPASLAPPAEGTRVVTRLDVYSVAKVSIVFYLILLVIFVIASVFLWLVADAFGAVDSIQRSVRSLFDLKSYVLHPGTIALYTSAAGAVLAVAGTIANVLAAVIYNLISEVIGGVRVGVSPTEDDEI